MLNRALKKMKRKRKKQKRTIEGRWPWYASWQWEKNLQHPSLRVLVKRATTAGLWTQLRIPPLSACRLFAGTKVFAVCRRVWNGARDARVSGGVRSGAGRQRFASPSALEQERRAAPQREHFPCSSFGKNATRACSAAPAVRESSRGWSFARPAKQRRQRTRRGRWHGELP